MICEHGGGGNLKIVKLKLGLFVNRLHAPREVFRALSVRVGQEGDHVLRTDGRQTLCTKLIASEYKK
jgi:hypothetical protein